ncbi:MAG: YceI family protein [Flavobacteriales bacterium]
MRYTFLFLLLSQIVFAQQFFTSTGNVSFYSSAPLEDIQADNQKMSGVIDFSNGQFAFKIAIQNFIFPNSLMQEHFNESYMESEKYPYAIFQGTINNFLSLDLSKNNEAKCLGILELHGVKKEVEILSTIIRENKEVRIESTFDVALKDFDIKIPKLVMYNIAENINVKVKASLKSK